MRHLLCEFFAVSGPSLGDNIDEIVRQDKGHSFSLHTKLALEVAQEVAKVNVHQLYKKRSRVSVSQDLKRGNQLPSLHLPGNSAYYKCFGC